MSKIVLKGYALSSDEDLSVIEAELSKHIELTRQEKGCLVFEVLQDQNNRNRFNVYEEFIDKESFEAHQVRVKSSKWGIVSGNLEKHYHIEEGVFQLT